MLLLDDDVALDVDDADAVDYDYEVEYSASADYARGAAIVDDVDDGYVDVAVGDAADGEDF